jgi:acetyltransferase-like isoleucine patch superfamily enzyme
VKFNSQLEVKVSMNTTIEETTNPEVPQIREEIRLQYHWYLLIFFMIYWGSWLIPGVLFFSYFNFILIPNFLNVADFISIFTHLSSLFALLGMPGIIIVCYLIRLLSVAIATRIFWAITEKVSPSKDGVIPRNIRSKTADYYHLRSFMLKYGKNLFTKGLFPWLSNWFFSQLGTSKIGKGSTIEESVASDKAVLLGKNCYVGVNSTLASHLVQGIFGNISYFKIKLHNNVTLSAMNQIGPGAEIQSDSFLLPLASTHAHSTIKGDHNYYWGLPCRKIFSKKLMEYLQITKRDMEINENPDLAFTEREEGKIPNEAVSEEENTRVQEEPEKEDLSPEDLAVDFTTSSAISRINIKFLIVYIPIFWLAGLMVAIYWYEYTKNITNWISTLLFLPIAIFSMIYLFIFGVLFFSKMILVLVNLIHEPKEGIFVAEPRAMDYEFWMLRTEIQKIALWLLRNSPLTWLDVLAFKLFGVKMDFSSHLNDAWCDADPFLRLGRKVLCGQGSTIMSSMVVGKYLLIKSVIFGDYSMIGGHSSIAPGSIIGHDSVIGALSTTTYNQICDPNWIYFGIPVIKLKENKYSGERRDLIIRRDVDSEQKSEDTHEVNIDEDKKDLIKTSKSE